MLKPEQAEQILHGNVQNLIRKVADGKTLTPSEQKLIEQFKGEQVLAKSVTELSTILEVSRQSIYNWQKEKGSPKTLDIAEWQNFIEQREATSSQGGGRVEVGGRHWTAQEIIDLKALETQERHKRLTAERKLKEIELKKAEEGWVPIGDAKKAILRITTTLSRLLENFPSRYASRIDPETPEETEEVLRECINETLKQLNATSP